MTSIEPFTVFALSVPRLRSSTCTSTEPFTDAARRTSRPSTRTLPFTDAASVGPSLIASTAPFTDFASSVIPCGTVMSKSTAVSLCEPRDDDDEWSSQPRFASGG